MKALLVGMALLAEACTQTVKVGSPEYPPARSERASDPLAEVVAEFSSGSHRAALRILGDTPGLANNDARALYLAGYAWLRLHRPDLSKPLLTHAAAGGFHGYPGWESTEVLLERIAVIEQLRPPASGATRNEDGLG